MMTAALTELDASLVRRLRVMVRNLYRVQLPGRVPLKEALARLREHPDFEHVFEYVEVDGRITLDRAPNDPLLDLQWNLRNTGQIGGALVPTSVPSRHGILLPGTAASWWP